MAESVEDVLREARARFLRARQNASGTVTIRSPSYAEEVMGRLESALARERAEVLRVADTLDRGGFAYLEGTPVFRDQRLNELADALRKAVGRDR